jgi:hypothetical protein
MYALAHAPTALPPLPSPHGDTLTGAALHADAPRPARDQREQHADRAGYSVFDSLWPPEQSPSDLLLGGLARTMSARCRPCGSLDGLLRCALPAAGALPAPC